MTFKTALAKAGTGLLILLLSLLVFTLIEGIFSVAHFASELAARNQPTLAERQHTEYDAELGWVSRRGIAVKDLYGPGLHLHTNSQGFRGTREYEKEVPSDKVRAVCSGDSFTLGYGVGDQDTWCAQLSAFDPRIEGVNMGQGGYGIGQAYLWYARDSGLVDHDLHLFAFIYDDFLRLGRDRFLGYGKPLLDVVDGELQVTHVPVPRRSYFLPWFQKNAALFRELRSVALLSGAPGEQPDEVGQIHPYERSFKVTSAILDKLKSLNKKEKSRLVVIYLPVTEDLRDGAFDGFRAQLAARAKRKKVFFVDLTEDLRAAPVASLDELFIPLDASYHPDAQGHYSAVGNRIVAERLVAHLHDLAKGPGGIRKLRER
jgi:hypothetical protein